MRAVVGLGNPGAAYERTRHNAGFQLADAVSEAWGFPRFRKPWRWRARVAQGTVGDAPAVVLKPQTYMNRSGQALSPLLKDPGFDPTQHLLVLVDDAAIPLGTFRLRGNGSSGGHNGLKSVAGRLQSEDFARLRIGVGPRADGMSDFVLGEFTAQEQTVLEGILPEMTEAVQCWTENDIELAMNRFNRRGPQRD